MGASIKMKRITIEIPATTFDLLTAIGDPKAVLEALADHAEQGIRRHGAWECEWIRQIFGSNFESNLELDPVCANTHWINFRTKGTTGQGGEE